MEHHGAINDPVDLGNQAAEFQHALDIANLWRNSYGSEARFRKLLAKLQTRYDGSQSFFGPENMKVVFDEVKRDDEKAKSDGKSSGKHRAFCTHCKRYNHRAEKCWDLHPELKPARK